MIITKSTIATSTGTIEVDSCLYANCFVNRDIKDNAKWNVSVLNGKKIYTYDTYKQATALATAIEKDIVVPEDEKVFALMLKHYIIDNKFDIDNVIKFDQFKLVIAGGREFSDYDLLSKSCDKLLAQKIKEGYEITIVSGGAKGADSLGEKYAKARKFKLKVFPADWNNLTVKPCTVKTNKFGKEYNAQAGLNRNKQMLEYTNAILCFWNGTSTGTKNMIDISKKSGKPVRVINY